MQYALNVAEGSGALRRIRLATVDPSYGDALQKPVPSLDRTAAAGSMASLRQAKARTILWVADLAACSAAGSRERKACCDVCGAGVRKEVRVAGVDVLIFWYRNEIFAIEARCGAPWVHPLLLRVYPASVSVGTVSHGAPNDC